MSSNEHETLILDVKAEKLELLFIQTEASSRQKLFELPLFTRIFGRVF